METESNSIFWYKKLIYFKREDNMFKLMWSYPHSIDEIFWFFIPWFNNNRTVCARCSRTEACQMKRGWKPSKTNLRKPDSWLKKPTENTTRWPFFVSWLKDFIPNSFTTHKYINKYFQPRHKHVLVVGFDDSVRCFFSFVHMIVDYDSKNFYTLVNSN